MSLPHALNWASLHEEFKASGLSVVAFRQEYISRHPDSAVPALKSFYNHFRQFKEEIGTVRKSSIASMPVRVVKLPSLPDEVVEQPRSVTPSKKATAIKMHLPSGIVLEFESFNPEQFAIDLARSEVIAA